MVKISVDTDRDSPETIRRIIQLLEQFAGSSSFTPQQGFPQVPPAPQPAPPQPASHPVSQQPGVPHQTDAPGANPFDMFNDASSAPSAASQPSSTNPFEIPDSQASEEKPSAPAPSNMFDVFSSTPPASEPNTYGSSDSPSAESLLSDVSADTQPSVIFDADDDLSRLDERAVERKGEPGADNVRIMEYD